MKKWMIITIIVVYTVLFGLIIFYYYKDTKSKNLLEAKVEELEPMLNSYYENSYDSEDLGKLFLFPGETNLEFDDDGIMSGEAFIYEDGTIEIALYDGKFCAYKKDTLEITRTDISNCVVNKTN
ncbi:MAG: hypothetical protein PHD02_00250 [Bacilli bacterium]|nr:hypothetical protein [Bacilli bacterium]